MKTNAVALCRVSSIKQRVNGDSLTSQKKHVYDFAENILNTEIEKSWELDVSAKKGANVRRKDLQEIYEYCRANKHIKHFIVDKVNRLVREVKVFYWYIVQLENLGVTTSFADPSCRDLNNNDQISQLKTFLAAYEAENDNRERSETTTIRMKDRVLQGYYIFPPKPGYRPSSTPGVHIAAEPNFSLLKEAIESVGLGLKSKAEALNILNTKGYKTKTGNGLRVDEFKKILLDDFYAGFVTVPKWGERFSGIIGHQTKMITPELHRRVTSQFNQKKTQSREQHNPEFPMSNLLHCDCEENAKFVGLMQGNGKGNFYPRYRCRKCGKQLKRDVIHKGVDSLINQVVFPDRFKNKIMSALEKVWNKEQQSGLSHITNLEKRLGELNEKKNNLIDALSSEDPSLRDDIRQAIERVKKEIQDLLAEVCVAKEVEKDLVEFTEFSLNFIKRKTTDWWEADFNDREMCKQLIFPGEIYISNYEKVCTPEISPILNLKGIKKEALNTSNSNLVGLVGFEPTTKGL